MQDGSTEPENRKTYPSDREDDLIQQGKEDKDTIVEVSVSIWFTKEFAKKEEDVQGYINTCFEEAESLILKRI